MTEIRIGILCASARENKRSSYKLNCVELNITYAKIFSR